jgi:quinol-cytochrome oxidoreductase complex cytochrome b subunit
MVSGFIRTGLESFVGSSEAFTLGAIQTDFIARLFSIHALILPFLMMLLLFYIKMILQINSSYSNNVFGYGFVALIILMGIFRSSEATLFPPSDAQVPTIIGIEPAWFFQPLHGIVSALPADAGILVISCAIVMFFCLPFISSYRLRMIVLAFIAIATLFFALAY